jgi:hypothetical protein
MRKKAIYVIPMENFTDKLLNQTFQLAYFIHRDKEIAKRITMAALERLETATLKQDKRLYYFDVRRRNRISLSRSHLVQRLVYDESENYEKQLEQNLDSSLSEERLLIHFIKHLVRITVRRRSLYVALGLGRILHRYTTTETMEIYNVVIQDPARVSDEDYFRAGKKLLMGELERRFGELLAIICGTHGEKRFAAHDQPERFLSLVSQCLSAFTPWHTDCHVPERFNHIMDELSAMSFNGKDPDEEHSIEINRFHALLHPTCFSRLLSSLKLAPPAQRLEIPRFCIASNIEKDDTEPDDHSGSAELGENERHDIRNYLNEQNRRRKSRHAKVLLFVAAGTTVAQFDMEQTNNVCFRLPEYVEFLEIRSRDAHDDLLLATHELPYDEYDQLRAQDVIIPLQNGQKIAFKITLTKTTEGATITVGNCETSPGRELWHWLKRQYPTIAPRHLLWYTAVSILLIAAIAGSVYLLIIKPTFRKSDVVRSPSPIPLQGAPTAQYSHSPSPPPSTEASPNSRQPIPRSLPIDEVAVINIPARSVGSIPDSLTRVEREVAVGLLKAHKVYLEMKGAEPLINLTGEQLYARLQASSNLSFTTDRDVSDIALKITVVPRPAGNNTKRIALTARIVDANGKVIWPLTPGIVAREYIGHAESVVIKLSDELLRDLKNNRQ